jgi:hypothetical protein
MVEVPPDTPVTTPVDETTVATEVVLLPHVPPAGELARVVVEPTQTTAVPVTVAGNAFTLTVMVR